MGQIEDGRDEPLLRHGEAQRVDGWRSPIWLTAVLVAALVLVGGHDFLHNTSRLDGLASSAPEWGRARPLQKLKKPLVILVSFDGFRWGYDRKVPTPNFGKLTAQGTAAEFGLIPVYPTATFPNHYSIVTGLYPAWHGIVQNSFIDPKTRRVFARGIVGVNDPFWWLGEPLWVTATKAKLIAATSFWPGSEVNLLPWECVPPFCTKYDRKVKNEVRVDEVLEWVDRPEETRPSFISLYFESPDIEGHAAGPDSPQVSDAVAQMDKVLGRLIDGLDTRGIYEDVSLIVLGDHGMVLTCEKKYIFLDDFKEFIEIPPEWVNMTGAQLTILPPVDVDVDMVYRKMVEGLNSGKINNSKSLALFRREDLPERLHYSTGRVAPIIGIPEEGYSAAFRKRVWCGGQHGYDNILPSMRTIFIAHGPQFAKGRLVPSFENVQVYDLVSKILDLKNPAPNNGTRGFSRSLLLPTE